MSRIRIAYAPYSPDLQRPGDRRRFAAYARARGIAFEIARAGEDYDLVIVSEVADITAWARCKSGKIVFDFIDSYLDIPAYDWRQLLRGAVFYCVGRHRHLQLRYKSSLEQLCERADAVVCSTLEQRASIQKYCSNVKVILDLQDNEIKSVKQDYKSGKPFHLVWEGLPSNMFQLKTIKHALETVSKRTPIVLNLVTDLASPRILGRYGTVDSIKYAASIFRDVRVHPWNIDTFSSIICGSDLAIIPIDLSNPLTRGKPENKLFLFWRMAMPVVATATPAYALALQDAGMEHFACRNEDEWIAAIQHMVADQGARSEAGRLGAAYVNRKWSARATLEKWDELFRSLGFDFCDLDVVRRTWQQDWVAGAARRSA